MKIHKIPMGPIQANCYIIETENMSVILDPCVSMDLIPELKSQVKYIIVSHCHFDHISNLEEIKEKTGAIVLGHRLDFPAFSDPEKNGSVYFMEDCTFSAPEKQADEDTVINFDNNIKMKFIHTPGHTPGGICSLLYIGDNLHAVFTGDTLFRESAGRTDLGGNPKELKNSLAKLAAMDSNTIVYSGHGPDSTIGHEIKHNPFM